MNVCVRSGDVVSKHLSKTFEEKLIFQHPNLNKMLRQTQNVTTSHSSTRQMSFISVKVSFVYTSSVFRAHIRCHSSTCQASFVRLQDIIRPHVKHHSSTHHQESFVYMSNTIRPRIINSHSSTHHQESFVHTSSRVLRPHVKHHSSTCHVPFVHISHATHRHVM